MKRRRKKLMTPNIKSQVWRINRIIYDFEALKQSMDQAKLESLKHHYNERDPERRALLQNLEDFTKLVGNITALNGEINRQEILDDPAFQ